MEVADRIVMNKGVIEQIGSPGDVYENRPAISFITSLVIRTACC